jgi:uncharacterized protein (TIGR02246 family)
MCLSPSDKFEIQEVINRLYQALDAHDAEGYALCFTPDGVSTSPRGDFHGRDAITNFVKRHLEKGNEAGSLHRLTNIQIWGDTTQEAWVSVEVMKIRVSDTPPVLLVSAFGTARVKKFETWQIVHYELGHRP